MSELLWRPATLVNRLRRIGLWDSGGRECPSHTVLTRLMLTKFDLLRALDDASLMAAGAVSSRHAAGFSVRCRETRDGRMWVSNHPGLGFTPSQQAKPGRHRGILPGMTERR